MNEWELWVALQWYDAISSGEKTIEGRVSDPEKPSKNYKTMSIGDIGVFRAVDEHYKLLNMSALRFSIDAIRHYGTVEAMLECEGLQNVLPGVPSIADGVAVYHAFPGYLERIQKFGIYAIEIGKKIE
ncbi:hypothetical protein C4573_03100 [Candidatus Woesearchaeota archaeon]|nr:MAG: hypothetical protein C4573_03100 [Candidatus Woesearchaeota archaeon]